MPVLITGATGTIGRALAQRLVGEGAEVRAYIRRDDAALRAAGVHVAIGPLEPLDRLEAALTRVHTIVHLVGGIWPERGVSYDLLNRDSVESAVIAARAAEVRRFVFLSFAGADPASPNEFLAAKARAEEHVRGSGMEHAIFRCAPVVVPGGEVDRVLARLRRGPVQQLPGGGGQRWRPLSLEQVVDAIVAADSREASVGGTWELGGSVERTLGDIADQLGAPSRRVRAGAFSGAPRALLDVYGADILPDVAAAEAAFGLRL